ncbi:GTA-gp10 family protein [Asticcacaulis sp. BYS171W]|uniref:GTA-gp10 family protein n=1 Tax=Asticcacaulis aquaticus TaxID=2984212 RepID=A0ABT5HV06_9CAUL|nr:GTA-gp10 family protein [Asticcacaulis aquaticus]MDC7683675.1 GTA-gp10 family protein [Asticcacaulis aquaticus]
MPSETPLINKARGEVVACIGGKDLRLCVTLKALAELETHFDVTGFEALAAKLATMGAKDVWAVLKALVLDEIELPVLHISLSEAIEAIVAAFRAMNTHD